MVTGNAQFYLVKDRRPATGVLDSSRSLTDRAATRRQSLFDRLAEEVRIHSPADEDLLDVVIRAVLTHDAERESNPELRPMSLQTQRIDGIAYSSGYALVRAGGRIELVARSERRDEVRAQQQLCSFCAANYFDAQRSDRCIECYERQ